MKKKKKTKFSLFKNKISDVFQEIVEAPPEEVKVPEVEEESELENTEEIKDTPEQIEEVYDEQDVPSLYLAHDRGAPLRRLRPLLHSDPS